MIGEKIRTLREDRALSIRQLAKSTSIAYSTMLNLEKDKNKPSAGVLRKLSDFFNVDVDYWFKNEKDVKILDDASQKLLKDANRLKPKEEKIDKSVKPVKQIVEDQEPAVIMKPRTTQTRSSEEQDAFLKRLYERQISIRDEMIGILRKEINSKDQLLDNFKDIIDDLMEELKKK
ncbi:MAG: helix-turn-helix domain-containing protein [Candidatus Cloacimonetes bacterium]|nr:helix-turn-helix domain-containing protein [Candidatus Cloacimonadota bacterium]